MKRIDLSEHYRVAQVYGLRVTFLPDPTDPTEIDEIVDIDWQPGGDPNEVLPLLARVLPTRKAYYDDMNHCFGKEATEDVFMGIVDYVLDRDEFDPFHDGTAEYEDIKDAALHLAECMFEVEDIDWSDVVD